MTLEDITSGPLTSPSELIDLEGKLMTGGSSGPPSPWAFRGQPQPFGTLVPSFQRIFKGKKSVGTAKIIEQDLMGAFRQHYAKLPGRTPDMPGPDQIASGYDMQCLSVMQHYGVPTRLLDWTSDFWTAIYFACAGFPGLDAELWFYDRGMFSTAFSDSPKLPLWVSPVLPPVQAFTPDFVSDRERQLLGELYPQMTPRMRQQAAHHTVSNDVFADHGPIIRELAQSTANSEGFQRVLIASSCKEKALRFLRDYKDVTAGTVFPDVEGLSKFLSWHLDSLVTTLF